MSINLEKYKESLLAAWKDVTDYKSITDWALFGYEGQTNDLKVVAKGDGGIDEMQEELSDGKIMYAFCKVLDPKTSLKKFVLINWQGEGAPHHRKATSANHIRDVSNFLKGFHLTVNARNEEEVEKDIIIEKLSKASASNYSFKTRVECIESIPVGSTYKRVIPQLEINSNERDKFWQKEEEEEKQRQDTEKKRREEEKKRVENEIKQREIEEAYHREAKIKERSKSISVIREAERSEQMRINASNVVIRDDDIEQREKEEMERKDRSEILRRQRSQEAQSLISKRTINARAVFEQNTSAGQRLQRRASYQPTTNISVKSPVYVKESSDVEKTRWSPPKQLDTHTVLTPNLSSEAGAGDSQANNVFKCPNNTVDDQLSVHQDSVEQQFLNGKQETSSQENEIKRVQPYLDGIYVNNEVILKDYEELDLKAEALYDYQAADDTEISFDPGDIITRIDQIDSGWWQGMAPDGSYGLFPANYVQLFDL